MYNKRSIKRFLIISFHCLLALLLLVQMSVQWLFPLAKIKRSLKSQLFKTQLLSDRPEIKI